MTSPNTSREHTTRKLIVVGRPHPLYRLWDLEKFRAIPSPPYWKTWNMIFIFWLAQEILRSALQLNMKIIHLSDTGLSWWMERTRKFRIHWAWGGTQTFRIARELRDSGFSKYMAERTQKFWIFLIRRKLKNFGFFEYGGEGNYLTTKSNKPRHAHRILQTTILHYFHLAAP